MSEKLVEVTLTWGVTYRGKPYGPGTQQVPIGLAKQLRQYDPEKADASEPTPESPDVAALRKQVLDLQMQVTAKDAEIAVLTSGEGTPLPDPFVNATVRELLLNGGFTTLEKVRAATDEELLALDGIAAGRLAEIRAALPQKQEPT